MIICSGRKHVGSLTHGYRTYLQNSAQHKDRVLYYGPFGTLEMTLFLTNQKLLLSCRLSLGPHTGSVCGLTFSRRSCGKTWTLGPAIWRWYLGICATGLVGGLLVG